MANYVKSQFHINKVFLGGNTVRQPVFKQAPNIDICEFPLCVPLRRAKPGENSTDYSGQLFIDVVVFGKPAKRMASILKEGDRVVVVGRIDSAQWTDKNNVKHSRLKVVADDVINVGRETSPYRSPAMVEGSDGATPPPGSFELATQLGGGEPMRTPSASDFRRNTGTPQAESKRGSTPTGQTMTFTPAPQTKAQDNDSLIDAELRGEGYSPF